MSERREQRLSDTVDHEPLEVHEWTVQALSNQASHSWQTYLNSARPWLNFRWAVEREMEQHGYWECHLENLQQRQRRMGSVVEGQVVEGHSL